MLIFSLMFRRVCREYKETTGENSQIYSSSIRTMVTFRGSVALVCVTALHATKTMVGRVWLEQG